MAFLSSAPLSVPIPTRRAASLVPDSYSPPPLGRLQWWEPRPVNQTTVFEGSGWAPASPRRASGCAAPPMPWVDGVHLCDGNACFADAACTAAADAAAGCVAEWPGCRRCTKPVDVHFAGGRQWLDWGGKWKPSANASLHAPANASLPACPGSLLVNDSSYPRASAAPPAGGRRRYPRVALADAAAPRVLGVTEVSCTVDGATADLDALFRRVDKLCASQRGFRLALNVFDATAATELVDGGAALRCAAGAARVALPRCLERPLFSKVAGMKTAFWREAITPAAVAAGGYEFVWLFDNDLAVDAVDLPALARTMAKVGTPLIQPRIAGSDDYFVHLRAHPEPPVPPHCLAVSTNYIAPWAPFFAAPAWAAVHTHMLARVPAGLLALTDWGVPDHWCRLLSSVYLGGGACLADEAAAEYGRLPACAVASVAARDLDGDTIGRANASARRAGAEALDAYDLFFPGCHYHPLYELPRMAEVAERSWRMSGRPDAKAGAECLEAA